MKKKIKRIGMISGILLMLSIIVFFCLSDMNKAKISLNLLGLHKENIDDFTVIKNMILDNQFSYCQERENIPSHVVDLIEKHYNETHPYRTKISKSTLTDIYAIEGESWGSGCQPRSDIPRMKFEELYYNDNALIISAMYGGFACSNHYDFYKINSDTLSFVGGVSTGMPPDIFFMALCLKLDEEIFDYSKVGDVLLETD